MSVEMHQLYPNFHSLISAPCRPLDPRMRRRSLVWTRSSSELPNQMNLSLSPAIYSTPQTTLMQPVARSLRRRSSSQAPAHVSCSIDNDITGSCTPTSQGHNSTPSPPLALASTPPPPFPFRDGDTQQWFPEGEGRRRMPRCAKLDRTEVEVDLKSFARLEAARNPVLQTISPNYISSASHHLKPSLSVKLPHQTGDWHGNPNTCSMQSFPGDKLGNSPATPIAARRPTPGRQRFHGNEPLRRRTLMDVVPTDWMTRYDGCQVALSTVHNGGGELHCAGNCQSSDSGVDVCEVDSGLLPSSRSAHIGAVRRPGHLRRTHVLSVFEDNLTKMSQRLQAMTQTTTKKDSDLHDLRNTIDLLRSQSGLLKQQTSVEVASTPVLSYDREVRSEGIDGLGRTALVADGKAGSGGGGKRNGWLRQSIEKAFRKKPTGQTVTSSSRGFPSLELTPESDAKHQASARPPSTPLTSDSAPYHEGQLQANEVKGRAGDLSPSNSSIASASSSWSSRSRVSTTGRQCGIGNNHDPEEKGRQMATERCSTLRYPTDGQSPTECCAGALIDPPQLFCQEGACNSPTSPAPTELHRLHQMLTESEMKLTDVQLQALARAQQIDDLSEQMKQLYAEVRFLRADNERLQVALSQQHQQQQLGLDGSDGKRVPERCTSPEGRPVDGADRKPTGSLKPSTSLISLLICISSPALEVCQPCRQPAGELAVAFTETDRINTWHELDQHLHWLLTQYIDRLGVNSCLGIGEPCITWYEVQPTSHSVRYRRDLKTVPVVMCQINSQTETTPTELEFLDVQALSGGKRLKVRLHLNDWLDELTLQCLLPKSCLTAMFDCLQSTGCLVLYGSSRDELCEITELFTAHLSVSRIVTSVYPVTLDEPGMTTIELTNVIHEGLRADKDDGKCTVKLVTINDLQLITSESILLEALDSINRTERHLSPLPGRQNFYILASWLLGDKRLQLPSETVQPAPNVSCTDGRCCWAAVDRPIASKVNQRSTNGPGIQDYQRLHQKLLNRVFTEAMQPSNQSIRSGVDLAQNVASWFAELCHRLEGLPAQPSALDRLFLEDWPGLAKGDLGETWFLDTWNQHIQPALPTAQQRVTTSPDPTDCLLEWLVSTWPWKGQGRRPARLQHSLYKLNLSPVVHD